MSAPAEDDHVRREALGLVENAIHGLLVNDDCLDIIPAPRKRAPRALIASPRVDAASTIERLCSAPVPRAATMRTRVWTGHGKCAVVVTAARA